MFIAIPEEFYVPVTYEYRGKLNIEGNEEDKMTRESKGKIETGKQYVKQVVSYEAKDLAEGKIYKDIDDEYVKEATTEVNKAMEGINPSVEKYNNIDNKSYCNKGCNRSFYEDIDYEYIIQDRK